MKNSFGNNVTVTLFGESHGASVGCVIDGLTPGLTVDEDYISNLLAKRRPAGDISTARRELDEFVIESGVFQGKTTGTPICIRILNHDVHSEDYTTGDRAARPGHADITAHAKYHGFEDYRGGGHFSGRITVALVAAAGIVMPTLAKKGIHIATHIQHINGVYDRPFEDIIADVQMLKDVSFPVLNPDVELTMKERIMAAKSDADSVGGVLETVVIGMPCGVGEPWFDTVEGMLSHALFSIPAIKGVEFGDGFALANMRGSQANDAWRMGDKPVTVTNHNGGVNGGITNSMPVVFRCAVKPTPTIGKGQNTLTVEGECEVVMNGQGRHDPCIVHRAAVVVDAITALTLCDMLTTRYGTDWLGQI